MTPELTAPISNASVQSVKGDAAPNRGSLENYEGAAGRGARVMSVVGIVVVGAAFLVGLYL